MKRKNIFKSLIAAAMALTMIFGAAPLSGFVGISLPLFSMKAEAIGETKTTEDGLFEYKVESTTGLPNTVTITRYKGPDSGEVVIPETIEGYEVKKIGSAFDGCKNLTEVTIPDSVTEIGSSAFYYCASLSKVELSTNLTKIGDYAFYGCINLKEIAIPDSIIEIGDFAFCHCKSLLKVKLSNGLNKIGGSAFHRCQNLTAITIPDSVTYIGKAAFLGCSSLTDINVSPDNKNYISIDGVLFSEDKSTLLAYPAGNERSTYTLPDNVTKIDKGAFSGCVYLDNIIASPNNENYSSVDGVLFTKDMSTLLAYPAGNERNVYTIPVGVSVIGEVAFFGCTSIEKVIISDGAEKIGQWAFAYCKNLKEIAIPYGVTGIAPGAFVACKSIKEITIPGSVTYMEIDFIGCSSLTDITVSPGNEELWSIDGVLFCENSGDGNGLLSYPIGNERSTYTVPDSVTSIISFAFAYCKNLKEVTISDSVTETYGAAFMYCTSLLKVKLSNNLTKIEMWDFYSCTSLREITIPDSVVEIGDSAFENCDSLKNVYYLGTRAQWQNVVIGAKNEALTRATVHCIDDPQCNHVWGEWEVIEKATYEKEGLERRACSLCNIEETRVIPKLVKATAIELSDSKKALVVGTSFTITATVKPDDAYNRTVIWSSSNPSVATVDENGNVTAIALGKAVITAESADGAKAECRIIVENENIFKYKLVPSQTGSESSYTVTITGYKKPLSGEITIPETIEGYEVTAIGRDAFRDCTEITSIVMPDSVTEIGSYAFSGCTSLSKIILPKGLKEIAVGIFCNCSALESISVSEGVTVIGDFAFTNCSDLKQVNLPSGLITIGSYRHSEGASFEGCSSLKEITIPDSVIMIENASFSGCSSLKEITIPDSVKVIGYATFSECTNLESVTIGSGVEQLDVDAFFKYSNAPVSCRRLANITVSPDNKTYSSVDGVLFNKDKSELLAYPIGNKRSSYTIPDGVTKIDQKAFYGCRYIETLTIPASVKEIEDSALGNCYDIRTINYLGTREQWKEVIIGADNYMFALVNVGCADDTRCDHVWGEWVVVDAATTEKEGLEKRVCSLCSAEETRKIPKLDVIKVTAIELSDSERTATVGTSFTITATVKPDDALNRTIIWSSSDPSIATVDENGTVTAIAEGEAIITAESADGVKAECKVTVEKAKESFGKKLLNVITAPFRAIINLFKKLFGK